MDSSFQLELAEHERIYSKIIEPISFLGTSSSEQPRMLIIAAQTGAGKSGLVDLSVKEFKDGNVVTVNTDDLRAYHPQFDEIVVLDDTRSAERTHHDASTWKNKLLSRSIETRRNIVLEGVFKDSHSLTELVKLAKGSGYSVTIRIVAAHERYSVWGINRRYEKEKIVRGHGRYVPIEYHDECYRKLLDSVEAVEQQTMADRIEVYNRSGHQLYSNELVNDDWKLSPNAKQAIDEERNRKLTDKECDEYIGSWPRVFEYMHDRGASSAEIEKVNALADRFIQELKSSN
ncbi:MAG TPA: zeta toxin family protein [Planktothrix sp.]|jgi:predicted ABC-type ATPase